MPTNSAKSAAVAAAVAATIATLLVTSSTSPSIPAVASPWSQAKSILFEKALANAPETIDAMSITLSSIRSLLTATEARRPNGVTTTPVVVMSVCDCVTPSARNAAVAVPSFGKVIRPLLVANVLASWKATLW